MHKYYQDNVEIKDICVCKAFSHKGRGPALLLDGGHRMDAVGRTDGSDAIVHDAVT